MTTPSPPPTASDHPPTWKYGFAVYHAETRAHVRAWLQANHREARGVWLCSWRRPTGRPACPYPEVVEEALCSGWIDSTVNLLDDERSLQLLTPRTAKSTWTRLNRRRVEQLEAAGLMTEAGRQAVAVAKANGWWTILDPVEDLVAPDDLARALDATPGARAVWDASPMSLRKAELLQIVTAARPETRARRIAGIAAQAANAARPDRPPTAHPE